MAALAGNILGAAAEVVQHLPVLRHLGNRERNARGPGADDVFGVVGGDRLFRAARSRAGLGLAVARHVAELRVAGPVAAFFERDLGTPAEPQSTEETRVGKAGVRTCRSRWSPTNNKKQTTRH